MRLGLATSAIALTMGGCSFMSELPGAGMVSSGYKSVTSLIPGMGPKQQEMPRGTVRPAAVAAGRGACPVPERRRALDRRTLA